MAPAFVGPITVGQTSFASANLPPIPVMQGDRLVMAFTIVGTGVVALLIASITGTASAGITIS